MEPSSDLHHNVNNAPEAVTDENKKVDDVQETGKKKSFLAKGKPKTVLEDKDANESGKSADPKTANPKGDEASTGGMMSVKDRMANLQQATSKVNEPGKTSTGPVAVAGGSIAERAKAFQQNAQTSSNKPASNEVKAEVKTGMSIQERMAAMKQNQESSDSNKPKEVIASGSVADRIKAMQAGGLEKSSTKSDVSSEENKSNVVVGESIKERMARMQNAMKTTAEPKEPKEVAKEPVTVGESVQDKVRRISTKNTEPVMEEEKPKAVVEIGGTSVAEKKKSFLAKPKKDEENTGKKTIDIGGGPSVQERAEMLRTGSKLEDNKEEPKAAAVKIEGPSVKERLEMMKQRKVSEDVKDDKKEDKPARAKIEGSLSVKERMELMKQQQQQQQRKVSEDVKEEKPAAPKVEGSLSIKERMELMKQGKPVEQAQEEKPAAAPVKIEGALSIKERMELMKQQQQQQRNVSEDVKEDKPAAAKVETGVSVKDRAQNMFAKKAEEPTEPKENTAAKIETGVSVKDRAQNMFAKKQEEPTEPKENTAAKIETGVSVKDRAQNMFAKKQEEPATKENTAAKVETGISVKDRTQNMFAKKEEEPVAPKENKVEVTSTLADRMKAFEEAKTAAATTVTDKPTAEVVSGISVKDRLKQIYENNEDDKLMGAPAPPKVHHIEGAMSVEERKKLLQEKKPEQRDEVQVGNVTVPSWVAKSMMGSDYSVGNNNNGSPQTKARTSVPPEGEEEPLYFPQAEFTEVMFDRDQVAGKKVKGNLPEFEEFE